MVSSNEFFQACVLSSIVFSICLWFFSTRIISWFISARIKAPTRSIAQAIVNGEFLIEKRPRADPVQRDEYLCHLIDKATGQETVVSLAYQGCSYSDEKRLKGDLDWMNPCEQAYIYDIVYSILKEEENAIIMENKRKREIDNSVRRAEAMKRYQ